MLQELFSSQARVAILGLFLLNPGDRFYMRQVAVRSGQPIRAVQRELARLEAAGLLSVTMDGNRKYYQIDVTGGEQKLKAVPATNEISQYLQIKPDHPILHLERKINTSRPGFSFYSSLYCNTSEHALYGIF